MCFPTAARVSTELGPSARPRPCEVNEDLVARAPGRQVRQAQVFRHAARREFSADLKPKLGTMCLQRGPQVLGVWGWWRKKSSAPRRLFFQGNVGLSSIRLPPPRAKMDMFVALTFARVHHSWVHERTSCSYHAWSVSCREPVRLCELAECWKARSQGTSNNIHTYPRLK